MARVTLNNAEVTKLLQGPNGPVVGEIQRKTVKAHGVARAECPVDTGRLRSSIRWRMATDSRGVHGIVGTDADYAVYVHQGTRPHSIQPRTKKALFWKGARHPVRGVQHPGTRGVPFLQ